MFLNRPNLLSEADAKSLFILRLPDLDSLLANLRADSPAPKLITGLRGMGKTTILRRIAIAVREEPSLSSRFIPLEFAEEQSNVTRYSDFLINCLSALANHFATVSDRAGARRIRDLIDKGFGIQPDPDDILKLLLDEAAQLNRRFILLMDNAERVLGQLSKNEERAFAKLIGQPSALVFLGATSSPENDTFRADGPLAFLKGGRLDLKRVDFESFRHLFEQLVQRKGNQEAKTWMNEDQPGRLKSIYSFTGGNLRAAAILFKCISEGGSKNIKDTLDELLDLLSPLYKARVEELAALAQKVLVGLAMSWPHTATARELANRIGEEVTTVSAQLVRLEKSGLVIKADDRRGNREEYQIAEQLLAIWNLMNHRRTYIHGYVMALHALWSPRRVRTTAEAMLAQSRQGSQPHPDDARILAAAVEEPSISRSLRYAIQDLRANPMRSARGTLDDWMDEFEEIDSRGDTEAALKFIEARIVTHPLDSRAFNLKGNKLCKLGRHREAEGAFREALKIDPTYLTAMQNLAITLSDRFEAERVFAECIEMATQANDLHQVCRAQNDLGYLLTDKLNRHQDAEQHYRLSIAAAEKASDFEQIARAQNNLGVLLTHKLNRHLAAEQHYLLAIAAAEKSSEFTTLAQAQNNLGGLLTDILKRHHDAQHFYLLAIAAAEKATDSKQIARAQRNLAVVKHYRLGLSTEAETLFHQSLKQDYGHSVGAIELIFDIWSQELKRSTWTPPSPPRLQLLQHESAAEGMQASPLFLKRLAETHHTQEFLKVLDDLNLGGEWLIIKESLKAVTEPKSIKYLVREVRESVEELWRRITGKPNDEHST